MNKILKAVEYKQNMIDIQSFNFKSNSIFYKLGFASLLICARKLNKNFKQTGFNQIQEHVVFQSNQEFPSVQTLTSEEFINTHIE